MSAPTPPIIDIAARRPHRADARRNFDAVLAAAREAFATHGTDASLEDIARHANVGIGTLYRNFPTRQDLLEAVYAGEVQELCLGAQAVSELEPWDAFTTWLDSFARYVPTKLALLQALNKDSEVFRACKSAMLASALPIFRARPAGRSAASRRRARRRAAHGRRDGRLDLRRRRPAPARAEHRAGRPPRALVASARWRRGDAG